MIYHRTVYTEIEMFIIEELNPCLVLETTPIHSWYESWAIIRCEKNDNYDMIL